ncbi:hypothetical protein [Aporhodopirellula aestuarii]|uniref:Uncharacterized protein n=1 Tax=Aporhodopirellula aestuarii TaxID=2950107 RepID=A0ABT0UCQ9_9BACT|nr:hypothetical protein [Aporhodopirellula aestuarii]MCM2374571.1 hypothetical protein [Aporhodopirellula aestuarii]
MTMQFNPSPLGVGQIIEFVSDTDCVSESRKREWLSVLQSNPSEEQVHEICQLLFQQLEFGSAKIECSDEGDNLGAEISQLDAEIEVMNNEIEPFTLDSKIPEGGLAPDRVFDRPVEPTSLPEGLKDNGPPPPPPGQQVSESDGFDSSDIAALRAVGDYRFGDIFRELPIEPVVIPKHPLTKFDESGFLERLRCSLSLTASEKYRLIASIPQLSQYQIDSLISILNEEVKVSSSHSPKNLLGLLTLELSRASEWMLVVQRFMSDAKATATPETVQATS